MKHFVFVKLAYVSCQEMDFLLFTPSRCVWHEQAARANALAQERGLSDRVSFQVADALQQPFPDGSFDLVWSLESGEHMPDKDKFVGELVRVCAPGGRIIIVTWCHRSASSPHMPFETVYCARVCDMPMRASPGNHNLLLHGEENVVLSMQGFAKPEPCCSTTCRNLEEGETELKANEKFLLDLICKAYYLPEWCSVDDYSRIFKREGLQVICLA